MSLSKRWWNLGIGICLVVGGASVFYLKGITSKSASSTHEQEVKKDVKNLDVKGVQDVNIVDNKSARKEGIQAQPAVHNVKREVSQAHKKLLREFRALAKVGKLRGLAQNFTVGKTSINDVYKEWGMGKAIDSGFVSYAPGMMKGTYAFQIGKSEIVAQIRHFGNKNPDTPDESQIYRWEIIATLGIPSKRTYNETDIILDYTIERYILQFVLSKETGKIDHVNVVSSKDTA